MARPQQEPKTGEKRGPGRRPKNLSAATPTPAIKKIKTNPSLPTALSLLSTPLTAPSPIAESPAAESKGVRLPIRVLEGKPLPSLREPQSPSISDGDYQSVAASGVLQASLNRSRAKWVADGIFQRYWVKPETGKNARPPPANNPEAKHMKSKGECRIRLEPHLLVADIYVEEKPRPKQFAPGQHAFGQPYRPGQVQNAQNRALTHHQTLPVQRPPPPPPPRPQPVTPLSNVQGKHPQPDPVITKLANRASSNPELKALMKEVATGNATPEQLRVFQCHIDELTAVIQTEKRDEEEQAAKVKQEPIAGPSIPPFPQAQQMPQIQQRVPYSVPHQQTTPPAAQKPQQAFTPPANLPVLLEFKTLGATEDRFLFPQNSILEQLSPQHELISFIVLCKGSEAVDPAGLDLDKEYWQPVTMMVEVAYGREDIIKYIRKWVKPADEVRSYMEDVMKRCHRAPVSNLALRLPFKAAARIESEDVSKEATPVAEVTEKPKPKPIAKPGRKPATSSATSTPATLKKASIVDPVGGTQTSETAAISLSEPAVVPGSGSLVNGTTAPEESGENNRPRRGVRKSVRISEG